MYSKNIATPLSESVTHTTDMPASLEHRDCAWGHTVEGKGAPFPPCTKHMEDVLACRGAPLKGSCFPCKFRALREALHQRKEDSIKLYAAVCCASTSHVALPCTSTWKS